MLLLGSSLHFVASTSLYVSEGFPSHDRVGYIYFIGLIQLASGILDLLSYRLLRTERALARRSLLVSIILITGYVLIISPTYPDFSLLFKLAPPFYLLYHWWAYLNLRQVQRKTPKLNV
jgi:uncharacterized membrane protein HdeD (DUF308 family)